MVLNSPLRALRAILFAMCVLRPAAAAAQIMEGGIARDARSRAPLECLHVALIDSSGRAVANTVTDSAGQFALEAPGPGAFRVRFESFAWESQVGPLDTLKEGDFKQRAYPVAFTNMLLPDTTRDTLYTKATTGLHNFPEWERPRIEPYAKLWNYLRGSEDSTTWQSRLMIPWKRMLVSYPQRMWEAGVTGSVIAQVIIDSSGVARRRSWRTIHATHLDFEKAVTDGLPVLRWRPARMNGRPVCELAQAYVRFDLNGRDPHGDIAIVWFMPDQ
jgi:hypothetical protein